MGQEHLSLPSLLGSVFGNVFAMQPTPDLFSGEVPVCPNCGLKFTDIGKSGKLGCGDCYQAFAEELQPSLKRIQGNVIHAGKIPLRNGERAAQRKRLGGMKQDLQDAIAAERYELAAEIRDQIKELEKNIGDREGTA
jgi:protein arginine kinase activator